MVTKIFQILVLCFIFCQCVDKEELCLVQPLGESGPFIAIGDSVFLTDTVYQYSAVYFITPDQVKNPTWKVGSSQSTYSENNFFLIFNNTGSYGLELEGSIINTCNSSVKSLRVEKKLTVVPGSFISPLVGKFYGGNQGEDLDFTIEIKYWIGERYPWWKDGAYSIHNLPASYKNSEQSFNGFLRPEINGLIIENGFNYFYVDQSGNLPTSGIVAYGKLNLADKDRIEISYTLLDTIYYNQTNQFKYLTKKFVGNRIP